MPLKRKGNITNLGSWAVHKKKKKECHNIDETEKENVSPNLI